MIADLGSGMNYRKKGLKRLLDGIVEDEVGRLVLTHKDRLLRFGAELIFSMCQARKIDVVIINQGEDTNFEKSWQAMCSRSSPSSRHVSMEAAVTATRS